MVFVSVGALPAFAGMTEQIFMPKQKSHSGMRKRVQLTGTGKLKRRPANVNHMLEHKSQDTKRKNHGHTDLHAADARRVKRMINS